MRGNAFTRLRGQAQRAGEKDQKPLSRTALSFEKNALDAFWLAEPGPEGDSLNSDSIIRRIENPDP